MNEVLTVAEIKSKYDSEGVLIEDPQTNDALEVQMVECSITARTEMSLTGRHRGALARCRFWVPFKSNTIARAIGKTGPGAVRELAGLMSALPFQIGMVVTNTSSQQMLAEISLQSSGYVIWKI